MNVFRVTVRVKELGLTPVMEYKSELPLSEYKKQWRNKGRKSLGKVLSVEQIN